MTAADAPERSPAPRSGVDALEHAAEAVRAAKVRYAEAFLRYKMQDVTDGQAHQQALLATSAELTLLEARLFIAQEEARR